MSEAITINPALAKRTVTERALRFRTNQACANPATCDGTCGVCFARTEGKRAISCLQVGAGWFSEKSGGLERYYRDLLSFLPRVGVAPTGFVVGNGRAELESEGSVRSVASAQTSTCARMRAVRKNVARHVSNAKFDLVASHFALYGWPAFSAARDLPRVVHFHGPWAAEAQAEGAGRWSVRLKQMIERRAYRRGARFITLSKAFARILAERYKVKESKISVVPGGVDASRFTVSQTRSEARAVLNWPSDRKIVLTVRRLVSRMGLEDLIDAAGRSALRDTLFLIVGKGPIEETLRRRVSDAGLQDNVRFLGHLPDGQLPLAYRAADLTVVPSISLEGFGLTTVESLMAGTPALVTPVGGLPEVVGGLSSDLITDGCGPDALARSLQDILYGHVRPPSASECHAYATSNFDWSVIAGKVRDVYEQAIAGA